MFACSHRRARGKCVTFSPTSSGLNLRTKLTSLTECVGTQQCSDMMIPKNHVKLIADEFNFICLFVVCLFVCLCVCLFLFVCFVFIVLFFCVCFFFVFVFVSCTCFY